MSTSSEFDLEKLFLPAWAQESANVNRYAKFAGDDRPVDRDRKFDDRGGRRPARRDGPRPGPGGGGAGRDQNRGPRDGQNRGPRPGGPSRGGQDYRGGDRREREMERPAPLPLPQITISLVPDAKGVESLARQIKISGRSFPLFDIAQMILQKPERQEVRFETRKKADGTVAQQLFLCAVDDTLWLSEQEAVDHVLDKHFGLFYQTEKIPTDAPKGTYTFVAQCGISGVILGPPNYHDYQNQLHRLHTERFSRMPFETFKARVKIVREEAVVKKWLEDQSFKTEYVVLNVPEPLRLPNREAVLAHFREVHLPNIIKTVEKHTLTGPTSRLLRSPGLQRALRAAWESQKRFPLQIATVLSQQFASHGLQFFKVNKTVTHVSVARPHYLDLETTPVSAQMKKIVEVINATPKCTRRMVVEKISPTVATAPAPAPVAPTEGGVAAPAAEAAPSAEQASIIGDLHWLIHQGHVIEFASGILETAKKPLPKPPKPVKAAKPTTAPAGATTTGEAAPTAEVEGESVIGETEGTAPEATATPEPTAETPAAPVENNPPPAGETPAA